ncbi:MAG TPA: hypothetical protein VFE16_03835 [Candidatus Cybelea sp.]|nr:hypothetical protein [Candidatus Cybelea sp.]
MKAIAADPERTVKQAARGVRKGAARAHDIGESVARAGELIQKTAELVNEVAARAGTRRRKRR